MLILSMIPLCALCLFHPVFASLWHARCLFPSLSIFAYGRCMVLSGSLQVPRNINKLNTDTIQAMLVRDVLC